MAYKNKFNTAQEAENAQAYDYNILRAKHCAEKTGIVLEDILNLNLHFDQEARHQYYLDHNIEVDKKVIHDINNYWYLSTRFSEVYTDGTYFYTDICDKSDVVYETVDVNIEELQLVSLGE